MYSKLLPTSNFLLLTSIVLLLTSYFSLPTYGAQSASDTWASVKKYIAVQPGTSESVWSDASRAQVTNGLMEMTPVGDGTYQAVLQLNRGSSYNFLFFAKTEDNPPSGLQSWTTYYDAVPTGGPIQSGTQPTVVSQTDTTYDPVHYDVIVNGFSQDARRVITVPSSPYLSAGDSFYVFANFADKPKAPQNFTANAIDTSTVYLTWDPPYGAWGTSGESFKAADVIAGGTYAIYRNTTGSTNSYTLIAKVAGHNFTYEDTTVTSGNTYWYVIIAYDAYLGSPNEPFAQLASDTSVQDSTVISSPIKVLFKVENFNWDYVKEHQRIVYLTPDYEKNKYFARRLKGRVAWVRLKD